MPPPLPAGELTGSILLELLPRKQRSARGPPLRAAARRNRDAAEELPGTAKLLGKAPQSQAPHLPPVKSHGGRSARASRPGHFLGLAKAPGFGTELPPSERQQVHNLPATRASILPLGPRQPLHPAPPAVALGCSSPLGLCAHALDLASGATPAAPLYSRPTLRFVQARMLLTQLLHAFGSNASLQGAALGRLRTEHALLDTTIRSLSAQLSARSGEWAQLLEAIRGRMDALVAAALQSQPNAPRRQQAGEALSAAKAAELAGKTVERNHEVGLQGRLACALIIAPAVSRALPPGRSQGWAPKFAGGMPRTFANMCRAQINDFFFGRRRHCCRDFFLNPSPPPTPSVDGGSPPSPQQPAPPSRR